MRMELMPFQISQIFIAQKAMKQLNWTGLTPTQAGIMVGDVIVVTGRPAETIVKVAADRDVDLVVVGTHTDPSLGAQLLGSTARKVTQMARKPVLVVPVYT